MIPSLPPANDNGVSPWSPLARRASPLGLGYVRGKLQEATVAPCATVVHTSGAGVLARATSARHAAWRARMGLAEGDTLGATVALYQRVMDASGHYVIGQDGTIVQLVPETHCAWHVGGAGSRPYFTSPETWGRSHRYAWWRARWPGYQSPRDLGGGRLWEPYRARGVEIALRSGMAIGSCNANSIGIEVVPPLHGARAPWSPEAWEALARLVFDIHGRHGIPIERDRVLTHSDAHPLSRTTSAGSPWDPAVSQYTWERLEGVIRTMGERSAVVA